MIRINANDCTYMIVSKYQSALKSITLLLLRMHIVIAFNFRLEFLLETKVKSKLHTFPLKLLGWKKWIQGESICGQVSQNGTNFSVYIRCTHSGKSTLALCAHLRRSTIIIIQKKKNCLCRETNLPAEPPSDLKVHCINHSANETALQFVQG